MRILQAMLLLSGTAGVLAADEIDLWIGFSGVQSQAIAATTAEGRREGQIKYVDVVVGSNETPAQAKVHPLEVHLSVSTAEGQCSVSSAVATRVKPSVSVLRFQVFYQNNERSSSPVEYMLRTWIRNSSDPQGSTANNRKEFALTLPAGGMPPTCVKLK